MSPGRGIRCGYESGGTGSDPGEMGGLTLGDDDTLGLSERASSASMQKDFLAEDSSVVVAAMLPGINCGPGSNNTPTIPLPVRSRASLAYSSRPLPSHWRASPRPPVQHDNSLMSYLCLFKLFLTSSFSA